LLPGQASACSSIGIANSTFGDNFASGAGGVLYSNASDAAVYLSCAPVAPAMLADLAATLPTFNATSAPSVLDLQGIQGVAEEWMTPRITFHHSKSCGKEAFDKQMVVGIAAFLHGS
jgi:hypothetical protein